MLQGKEKLRTSMNEIVFLDYLIGKSIYWLFSFDYSVEKNKSIKK